MLSTKRYSLPYCFLALLPLACGRLQGNEEIKDQHGAALTTEEIRLARHLAEEDLNPSPGDRTYFIKMDLLPAAQADDHQRQVNVIHYRYQGDETIITTVDLHSLEVLKVDKLHHFPTGLAPEEKQRAETLARNDPHCRMLFSSRSLQVEFRPMQILDSSDARFGHRLVHVMLREGPNYRSQPRILVDLTRETVAVDETPTP